MWLCAILFRRSEVYFLRANIIGEEWLIVLEWELQGGDMVDCARMGILRRDMVDVPAW